MVYLELGKMLGERGEETGNRKAKQDNSIVYIGGNRKWENREQRTEKRR